MTAFLGDWLLQTWHMILAAAPWLCFGFAAAGLIHLLMPTGQIVKHLGRPGWGSVVKAALIGVPLPLCSCSVIPVGSSLRRGGASKGATASFFISTPETGVDSIAISYALLGPWLAIARPIAAFITALTAGSLIALGDRSGAGAVPTESAPPGGGCCCGHAPAPAKPTLSARFAGALDYGLVEMFASLAHWLVLGFVLGGLVAALMPAGWLERWIGSGPLALVLMAIAGLPLYVCATSATPFAAALIAKGLSPGAALVFLLVGPATNTATMLVVGRELGRRELVIYVATIAVVALALGALVDALPMDWTAGVAAAGAAPHEHFGPISWVFGGLLLVLMANGLRIGAKRKLAAWRATAAPRAALGDSLVRPGHPPEHDGAR